MSSFLDRWGDTPIPNTLQTVSPQAMQDWRNDFAPVSSIISGTLPSSGGSSPSGGGYSITPGAGVGGSTFIRPSAGIVGASIGGPSASVPSATPAGATPQTGKEGTADAGTKQVLSADSVSDYFARAIIVILGFIFVAVGLNMLRGNTGS